MSGVGWFFVHGFENVVSCVEIMFCRLMLSDREKRKQNSRRVMLSSSQLANFQENGSDLVELSSRWTLTPFWLSVDS